MKRLIYGVLIAIFALALTIPALAIPTPTVLCQGSACGGVGPRLYQYDVSVLPEELFTSFGVGVHDPVLSDYTNITVPAGWQVTIHAWTMPDDPFTAHNMITPGPSGLCPFTLFWWSTEAGSAVQSYVFGFDHLGQPHDTGWVCSGIRESWLMPVGAGQGPVHSPVPEPGSLFALTSGLAALAGMLVRKRR